MNETNKEVKKVLDYFYSAGHKIINITSAFDTKVWLDKTYEDVVGIVQGGAKDWNIKDESKVNHIEFKPVKNFLGLGIETVVSNQTRNHFVIELESDTNKAYIVVKVENGMFQIGNQDKVRITNNKHTVLEVGFGKKEFVDNFGEYNVFNQKQWNELTKYALNLENRL